MFKYAITGGLVLSFCLAAVPALAGKTEKEAIELYKKGLEFGRQKDFDQAIDTFRQAIAKTPKFSAAYANMGLAFEMSDRWPEALACYDQAIAIDSKKTTPYAHSRLGDLYRKMGLLPMAAAAYTEAAKRAEKEKKPKKRKRLVVEAHSALAEIYYDMKLYPDAIRECGAVLALAPESAEMRTLLGNSFYLQEKYADAEAEYARVLKKDPNDAGALFRMGLVLRKLDKPEKAKEAFQKACDRGHERSCREAKPRFKALHR